MKKSLLLFVTFFLLVSLVAQSKNYTVDMYALSNYSREYYAVEKLDFQTPDGNEFCVMALQKNGGTDKYRRSKIPVLILKKKDGNRANVITARMESIEMEPNTVGEGLQSIKPYESGFFIQQILHEAVLRLGIPKAINPPDANPPKCCSYKVVAAGFHALSTENVSYLVKIGLVCLSMMYFGGYYGRKI